MTHRVTLRPSGHTFSVEGHDTLLQGGLKAGHPLPYGCSNGTCGDCKARLVSGRVEKTLHSDYVFSGVEKSETHLLMCANTPLSDVELDVLEAGSAAEIPETTIPIKVRKIERPADGIAILRAKTPRTKRLRFLAGQYVRLSVEGGPAADCAIASCPCDDMNLEFHIPWQDDSLFSAHVHDRLKPSDSLVLEGPRGNFTLRDEAPGNPVFIAWGTGFGPVKSLIEHVMSLETAASIRLFRGGPGESASYLDNLCRSWEDALDEFHYRAVPGDDPAVLLGVLDEELADLGSSRVYMVGPDELLDAAKSKCCGHGLQKEVCFLEPLRCGR